MKFSHQESVVTRVSIFWILCTQTGRQTPQIANPQTLGLFLQSQIPNFLWFICKSRICKFLQNTTLSQNSHKSNLLKRFLCNVHSWIRALLYSWVIVCWSFSTQITKKIRSANRKSVNLHWSLSTQITKKIGSVNPNPQSPQICGFAICGTYLRTAHLCMIYIYNSDAWVNVNLLEMHCERWRCPIWIICVG